jgi:Gamma-glutamyl cyclotransferase, AIG2-like
MSEKLEDIFFYGLFMDENVLRDNGVQPRSSRRAVVHGYQLRIGKRAMLVQQPSSKAFGMVYALTEREINSLYAAPGLEMYRRETVVATFENGSRSALTTFNLQETTAGEESNTEYITKLRSVLERLGFPVTI